MDKRTILMEDAILRLANARRELEEFVNMANAIAERMKDNDIEFFVEPKENLLIIASLKAVTTRH